MYLSCYIHYIPSNITFNKNEYKNIISFAASRRTCWVRLAHFWPIEFNGDERDANWWGMVTGRRPKAKGSDTTANSDSGNSPTCREWSSWGVVAAVTVGEALASTGPGGGMGSLAGFGADETGGVEGRSSRWKQSFGHRCVFGLLLEIFTVLINFCEPRIILLHAAQNGNCIVSLYFLILFLWIVNMFLIYAEMAWTVLF